MNAKCWYVGYVLCNEFSRIAKRRRIQKNYVHLLLACWPKQPKHEVVPGASCSTKCEQSGAIRRLLPLWWQMHCIFHVFDTTIWGVAEPWSTALSRGSISGHSTVRGAARRCPNSRAHPCWTHRPVKLNFCISLVSIYTDQRLYSLFILQLFSIKIRIHLICRRGGSIAKDSLVTRAQTPLARWSVPDRYTPRMELKPTHVTSKKYSAVDIHLAWY